MPAKFDLTWEPATFRWKKIYKGTSYTVSCRILGVPPTKQDSYQAANSWWQVKKAEIDAQEPPHPHKSKLETLARRLAWAKAHGDVNLADSIQGEISKHESDIEGDLLPKPHPSLRLSTSDREISKEAKQFYEEMMALSNSPLADTVSEWMDDALWDDRLTRDATVLGAVDRTMSAQVERFLALERARVDGGQLSVSEFDTIRRCLRMFRDYVGESNSVSVLDAERWESWWSHLMTQDVSIEYKKKRLRIARSFVAWLAEKGLIPLPLNLHSRRHRFGGGSRSIPTIPVKDVQVLVSRARGQLALHLLLMLNCGMTQVDISDLHPREVDWERGRIKRKRSKTDDHEHVPIVDYVLWPATWRLLQEFGHRVGPHLLLTASGRTWLRDELLTDGKRYKVDAIKSNYVHLEQDTSKSYPLKLFRKTSATLIESHELYGRYKDHFLGHAPRSLAERHYAAPSGELFDKIIEWLGCQLGPTVTG